VTFKPAKEKDKKKVISYQRVALSSLIRSYTDYDPMKAKVHSYAGLLIH
jgi:hypothetical protein